MLFVHVVSRGNAWVDLSQEVGMEQIALEIHAQATALINEGETLLLPLCRMTAQESGA